jgi:hypothetical protein
MHSAKLILEGVHTGPFSSLTIYAQDNLIFHGQAENYMEFNFPYPDINRFIIKIKKTGKTKEIVDKKFKQEIIVASLSLNGCDMHADKFGEFFQFDNTHVDDQKFNTDKLYLNGEWTIDVPIFDYKLNHSALHESNLRDVVAHSDIACFGCSFTYGANLQTNETWPYFLSQKLVKGRTVKNYGRSANSTQEIMATALDYAKNYKVDNIVCLLPHPCRMQLVDPDTKKLVTLLPSRASLIEKKFPQITKNIVLYGETSLLFAGYVKIFKDIINQINSYNKKIYISCWNLEFYQLLESLSIDNITLLPYYERDKKYPFADAWGHPGKIHNRLFAENIVKYIL